MANAVYARVLFYALSSVLAALVPYASGWGVSYDAASGVLSIDIEVLAGAVVAAVMASGGVMALWGKK
ncbi:hypothetical protein CKO11_16900 [Rhodobacter sp. TJ_12]|uniref:hypothetical protein n=1 Tax=Rhodobacter sp. TJ_12 TaxID=2029399 RepID=UPI001CC18A8A|nr:hypothetical protein [Rhodobacter sp. TJ_12]MBZ4024126.1 hypothetical protein [Rhodobacter sp. TJ_12]